ncbi:chaperonin 10-like protein [Tricladium varicosporioides]|nr:chaperonin 10-like protein [Hymenoscyphus varicosporioides]
MTAEIPKTMRGNYLEEFGKPYVYHTNIPVPQPRDDELLIRVEIAGYCHTETIVADGDYKSHLPLIPGHENVGTIAWIGPKITQSFAIGDRVGTSLFQRSCGKCPECTHLTNSTPNFCRQTELAGLTQHGGMAEYLIADPYWTVKLPDELSFEQAAPLMCAGSTMFNSLRAARLEKGGLVAIVGVGGLGHLGVQFAKAMGYKTIAIDTRSEPLDLVSSFEPRFRPDLILNPSQGVEHALSAIQSRFPNATGVAAAIVSTDSLPAFTYATDLLSTHGTLVVVGQPKQPLKFHWSVFVSRDISIVPGGLGQPDIVREMVDMVAREGIRSEVKVYSLEDINELVKDFHRGDMKGKLVVKVRQ